MQRLSSSTYLKETKGMLPMKELEGFEGCHISIYIRFHVSCGSFRCFCYLNTSYKESDYIIFTPNFSVLHSFCAFPIGHRQNGNGLSVLGQLLCQCQSRHLALFSIKLCYIVVLKCCIISVRGNFGISMWHINSERWVSKEVHLEIKLQSYQRGGRSLLSKDCN